MSSQTEHQRRAEDNWRCARKINEDLGASCRPWAITALFYSALHYIDSLLASSLSYHPKSHQTRNGAVQKLGRHEPWSSYRRLIDESKKARYELGSFTDEDFLSCESRLAKIAKATKHQVPEL
jgi:hypothetical protein